VLKKSLIILLAVCGGFLKGSDLQALVKSVSLKLGNDPTAVTCTLLAPTNGSTVSGVINLQATASSTMGPIVKVEFYRDGLLIGTVTNKPTSPQNLKVM
jgi:hypothetical protein